MNCFMLKRINVQTFICIINELCFFSESQVVVKVTRMTAGSTDVEMWGGQESEGVCEGSTSVLF